MFSIRNLILYSHVPLHCDTVSQICIMSCFSAIKVDFVEPLVFVEKLQQIRVVGGDGGQNDGKFVQQQHRGPLRRNDGASRIRSGRRGQAAICLRIKQTFIVENFAQILPPFSFWQM